MAQLATNVRVSEMIPVGIDSNNRPILVYNFSIPAPNAASISVEIDNNPVAANQYQIEVDRSGAGGTLTFLDPTQVGTAFPLANGQMIQLTRNSVLERVTSFGTSGYASSRDSEIQAAALHRILEEVINQLSDHTQIFINARPGAITLDYVSAAFRQSVQDSAVAATLELDGHTLRITDHNGNLTEVEIPSVAPSGVTRIQPFARGDATNAMIRAALDPILDLARIDDLEQISEAIRDDADVGTPDAAVSPIRSNEWFAIPGGMMPVGWENDETSILTVVVKQGGDPDVEHTWKLSELAAKSRTLGNSWQAGNSLEFDGIGTNVKWYIGVSGTRERFLATNTAAVGLNVTTTWTIGTVEGGVRAEDSTGTPVAGGAYFHKLKAATSTTLTQDPNDAKALIIEAEFADGSLSGEKLTDDTVPESKLDAAARTKLNASPTGVTRDEVVGIVRQEEAERFIDSIIDYGSQTEVQFEAETFTMPSGVVYDIGNADVAGGTDNGFLLELSRVDGNEITEANVDELDKYHWRFGDRRFSIASATHDLTPRRPLIPTSLGLDWGADSTGLTWPMHIALGEPIEPENYVPEGSGMNRWLREGTQGEPGIWSPLPDANTTQKGVVQKALLSEAEAGTDTAKYMTPQAVVRSIRENTPPPVGAGQRLSNVSAGQTITNSSDGVHTYGQNHPLRLAPTRTGATGTQLAIPEGTDGEIHLTLRMRLTTPTASGWGFYDNPTTDNHRDWTETVIIQARDIRVTENWGSATNDQRERGVKAFDVPIFNNNTEQGRIEFYVNQIAGNLVNVYNEFTGALGGSGMRTVYTADVEGGWWPEGTAAVQQTFSKRSPLRARKVVPRVSAPSQFQDLGGNWPATSTLPSGYTGGTSYLGVPDTFDEDEIVFGFWVVSKVGGTDEAHKVDEAFLALGPSGLTTRGITDHSQSLLFFDRAAGTRVIVDYAAVGNGTVSIGILSDGSGTVSQVPQNSYVEVYEAGCSFRDRMRCHLSGEP